MVRADLTDLVVLLDRSGSMESIRTDMEGGFKSFLEEQKSLPGHAVLSLSQFDNVYEKVYVERPIAEAPPLRIKPRNSTALLDAMGRLILETGQRLAAKPEADRPSQVIFMVITDGLENSSVEFTREKVMSMVRHQEEKYSWRFLYLGANQDAIAVAEQLGISAGAALTYSSSRSPAAVRVMSKAVAKMRSASPAERCSSIVFSDEDRKEAGGS